MQHWNGSGCLHIKNSCLVFRRISDVGVSYSRKGSIEGDVGIDLQGQPVLVDGRLDVEHVEDRRDREECGIECEMPSRAYPETSHRR